MIKLGRLFDEDETNAIRNLAVRQKVWEEYTDPKSFLKVRRTYIDAKFVIDKVSEFTTIPIAKLQRPMVCCYKKGDYFGWHSDIVLSGNEHQHTCMVQLSDHSEYGGGDFEVEFKNKTTTTTHIADRNEGRAFVFPSSFSHRVTEITRGERWSLIVWGTPLQE